MADPVVEAPPEGAPAPEETPEATPDELTTLKAQLAELQTEREKLTHRLSTEEGRARRAQSDADIVDTWRREQRRTNDTTQRLLEVLLGSTVSEDKQPVVKEAITRIQQESQAAEGADDLLQEAGDLQRDLYDEAREVGFSVEDSPEFQAVRDLWNRGWSRDGKPTNVASMRAAVREARRVRRETQTQKAAAPAPKPKTTIPAPRAVGSPTAVGDAQWLDEYALGKHTTAKDHQRAQEILTKL